MTIAGALSNALSGLQFASRAADLTANNVANALTDGFARRELLVSARTVGGDGQGVQVDGIARIVDRTLLSDRRLAEAATADREKRADFYVSLEAALGGTEEGSLLARISEFDSALIAAASRPESEARLTDVLQTAQALSSSLNGAADLVQSVRQAADAAIADQVDSLNGTLVEIAELNRQITSLRANRRDTSALEDGRQSLVDRIAAMIPLREMPRDHGQIALYSTGGAVLLDGRASEFAFTETRGISAGDTLASGVLSGLTLNGWPVVMSSGSGLIAGGTLAATFSVRDELAPAAQVRLDALGRDLVERFEDPAVVPGTAGLFTDEGAALDPTRETGLAGRIAVNADVDPEKGGLLRLLRDGIGAGTEGAVGDSTILRAMRDVIAQTRMPSSGAFSDPHSLSTLAAELVSSVATFRLAAESESSFATARWEGLRVLELEQGVDTDREMEQLLLIEQAFGANAKVVSAVDEMMSLLLEM